MMGRKMIKTKMLRGARREGPCMEVVFAWRLSWEGNNLLQIEKLLDRLRASCCVLTLDAG